MEKFSEGEIVLYMGKDREGNIYTIELGKIKKLCKDGAFVWYNTGDTAAKTRYEDLYKIKNEYAIDDIIRKELI